MIPYSVKIDVGKGCIIHGLEDFREVNQILANGRQQTRCYVCNREEQRRQRKERKLRGTEEGKKPPRVGNKYVVLFTDCSHHNIFVEPRPERGGSGFCRRCNEWRTVKSVRRYTKGMMAEMVSVA